MDIYRPETVDGFEWVLALRDTDWDVLTDLALRSRESPWQPVPVRRERRGSAGPLAPADLPWLSRGALVLTQHAKDALHDVLAPWGDILPLICANDPDPLWVFSCELIDALDVEQSEIKWLSSGRIMRIVDAAFKPGVIPPGAIFKLPQMPRGPLYTTSALVDRVREAGLTGCEFVQVGTAEPRRSDPVVH